jgi:hypothetical protein
MYGNNVFQSNFYIKNIFKYFLKNNFDINI